MTDVVTAAAQALAAKGRFVAVTGGEWGDLAALVEAAGLHVVAPGPTTRMDVAAGVRLGGREAVVVLDGPPPPAAAVGGQILAVTDDAACAAAALREGWAVVQPWAGDDVAALLSAAPRPAVLLLDGHHDEVDIEPPLPRMTRQWLDGELATLVGSGAAVGPMLRLASRLLKRGVDVSVVEVAVLTTVAQEPLAGGTSLLVADPDAAAVFRRGHWPETPVHAVAMQGTEEADLVGAVLALVPAA